MVTSQSFDRVVNAKNEWVSILDTIDEIVLLERENGEVARCNKAAAQYFGIDVSEAPGKVLVELLGPEFPANAMRARQTWVVVEHGRRHFEIVNYPLPDTARTRGWVHILRDVTMRRRLEAIAEGANVSQHLGFMVSGLRHELGNPVTAAKTAASVLKEDFGEELGPVMGIYVDRILDQLGRMEYLMRLLRSYDMHEVVEPGPTDLGVVARDFIRLSKQDFADRGVDLALVAANGKLPLVVGDPRAMHHVLLNLAVNASDATEPSRPGRVELRVREHGDAVLLEVRDNGRGMPPSAMANLFRPLHTDKPNGDGLGLVIVKKLLDAMGATIDIESTEDVGTSVRMLFNVA